ncbi:uncharacterized protein Z518_00543 [Rhinocladiella mackenziei CBS 650.93]|uniref:Uncharacterized protein n=1 Tax=Rhinocladiella mackenziei CBS 650.93 TaxID=1442369 RepID=A0A0D2HFK8_9EURO|nr:uncharacterized protein Z518_00543 [Rhinocladiella mackenziei CBS 650.93]KIX09463.1 hypothetical protein Z518_00543 [Rhinocladiella mackenziei CBS 650.93]
MSDIEDYAYSPYDDIEDILYNADPAPELADDLADHAIHSPVYQDEIAGFELQDYFSDWEYYSDDYMDDDPVLMRQTPQVGSPPRPFAKENDNQKVTKRGKKRKLADTLDIPPVDPRDRELLTRCIKGTVWARPSERSPPLYRNGQESKVALMKNWKEVFAITDDGWHPGLGQSKEDESWAHNMSLADMGLQNVHGQTFHRDADRQETEFEDDDEFNEFDGEEDDVEEGDVVIGFPGILPASVARASHLSAASVEDAGGGQGISKMTSVNLTSKHVHPSNGRDALSEDDLPRKQRRLKLDISSPPHSTESAAGPAGETDSWPTRGTTSPYKGETRRPENMPKAQATDAEQVKAPITNGSTTTGNRKRKATEEPYVEEGGPSKSTRSSRA